MEVLPGCVRFSIVRTAMAIAALALLAALSMAHHWAGDVVWETDALFYQAQTEEILGAEDTLARERVFGGPLAEYERGLEAESPDPTRRVTDPAWVEYSSDFYARRLLLPALAAALNPLLGLHGLETLSLLGFVLVPALLFLLLRRRFSLAASLAVAAATILWPPLRAWSVFPLTDSSGLAMMIAGLLFGLLAIERGRGWLAPWTLCVLALAFTRDMAFMLVVPALLLFAVERKRRPLALFVTGAIASLPALFVHSVSLSKGLAYVFAGHTIPTDTSWGAVTPEYLPHLGHMAGRYLDYAAANPHIVAIAFGGIVAAFALAPRRDSFTLLVWGTFPGYLLLLAIGPSFSAFRYELVLVPLIALGYGQLAELALRRLAELRAARTGRELPSAAGS